MASAGVPVDESLVVVGGYRPETTEGPVRLLLGRADPPTAVFATNDLSAIRTMELAVELGLAVPDDLSVIGFDNVPESAMATPPLTTINQPLRERGATALEILVALMEGREPRATHVR